MDLTKLLHIAYDHQASDVHVTVGTTPVVRIHGRLEKIGDRPLAAEDTLAMAREITHGEQFEQFQREHELDFSYELAGICRFRVNLFKQNGAVGIVCRVIQRRIPTLADLQFPEVCRYFTRQTQGLLLVTGPTGSGKSTTLASMIDDVNETMHKHILTLEDPIEYVHRHKQSIVNQREIGQDSRTFHTGLRAALRQDPDIILVGEMRDVETIATAITAAETGHLVLSTLHTANAAQTVERMIDVFPGEQQQQIRTQLAAVLVGVISQRLLPLANGQGRTAALEILVNNPAVANLIRSDKTHQIDTVLQTSRAAGMQTMQAAVEELVRQKLVTLRDANEFVPGWQKNV